MPLRKPLMPACFLHWTEPADAQGDEVFRLASWRRTLTLKGKAFRDFEMHVLPLLDGRHCVDDICDRVAHVFRREDVVGSLTLLAAQRIVIEGDSDLVQNMQDKRVPQLGWFAETSPDAEATQQHLDSAHVVLFGAGAQGAVCARALVAAGIGRLTIVDAVDVARSDLYFSGLFAPSDTGMNRAAALAAQLSGDDTQTDVFALTTRPADAGGCLSVIAGASLVLCCLDSGELNLANMLNLACRQAGVPWIASSLEGVELIVGPGFDHAPNGPCYMCWRQREVAAASNPQSRYALEMQLDNARTDLSGRRENLAPAADIVGGMLSAEALTWLTGIGPANLTGRFLMVQVPGLRMEKHTVLRKPGCPVCSSATGPR